MKSWIVKLNPSPNIINAKPNGAIFDAISIFASLLETLYSSNITFVKHRSLNEIMQPVCQSLI